MQLGLDMEFICQDIMEDDFVDNLLAKIGNKQVDVVTGGPSCQSFSLCGLCLVCSGGVHAAVQVEEAS